MSPPVVYDNQQIKSATALPQEERRAKVTEMSTMAGAKAALQTSVVWLPFCAYLQYGNGGPSKFFRQSLNVSAKTAVVIMPIVFAWAMVGEQVASRMANPQIFENDLYLQASQLPLWKRGANYIYENPMRSLIMMGVPGVIAIFASKGGQSELSMSQRVMHTRVVGQFSILSILVGTFAFHDYMRRVNGGRFLEPWEEELLKREQAEAQQPHKH